jgi:4-hydroxybenzoyl-CoA thioesterase/acyl-CoA thioester hydrolase
MQGRDWFKPDRSLENLAFAWSGVDSGNPATPIRLPPAAAMLEDTPTIETREEVMFFDTDIGGVVHNIAYLRMIETARTRLAAKLGMKLREMAQTQIYPVVVRTEIDYRKPATLGDELVIKGWLDRVERARFWCAFEIHRLGEESTLIRCRQSLALVKMPEGRPLRLPEEWSVKYSHLFFKQA